MSDTMTAKFIHLQPAEQAADLFQSNPAAIYFAGVVVLIMAALWVSKNF